MHRDDPLQLMIPDNLAHLMRQWHRRNKSWRPKLGTGWQSAGFAVNGLKDFVDFEISVDRSTMQRIDKAWAMVPMDGRIVFETEMGWLAPVATIRRPREVALQQAVEILLGELGGLV